MKKLLAGIITAAIIMTVGTSMVFAGGHRAARNYMNADAGGICRYVDADDDGICDNCDNYENYHHYNHDYQHSSSLHHYAESGHGCHGRFCR
ncbi:MAG: hypothetical protein ACOX8E_08785 [Ruminococcus sp.]